MLFLAGYVMLADYVNLRKAQLEDPQPATLDTLPMPQPWGGYGWRHLAWLSSAVTTIDPEVSAQTLRLASTRYPLDALQWLAMARLQARQGAPKEVGRLLARAGSVQPLDRRSLWSASQIALQTGNAGLAERQLRQWLELYPGDTGQALFIGQRWIDQPGILLDRMLPDGREYLAEAMEVARRQTDVPLAEAVWDRLAPKPDLDDPLFLNFVELLIQTGDVSRAVELWAERDPAFEPGRLINGDFARAIGQPLALNWRVNRPPAGVRIGRDEAEAFVEPASLKVEFNGKENVHLGEPWIRIPVEPGQHYRLSGAWRGDSLTTRSLPYWYLTGEGGDLRERVPAAAGNFAWQRWQIEFKAPEEARLVRLQLRRDRTNAFDRNIDGTLWLDDFRLEPIAEPRTLQSAASEALGRQANNTGSGFRVPVSGERRDGAAPETGKDPVGAGSSRVARVSEAHPGPFLRARSSPDARFALIRATTTVEPWDPAPESSTGVGAGPAGDDRGPETRISSSESETADRDAPARKPETGNPKPARSAP